MIVSSTEFQQNVGYYLGLADKGEEIIIQKKKPKKVLYTLNKKDNQNIVNDNGGINYLQVIDRYSKKSGGRGEIGLKLQKRVRD